MVKYRRCIGVNLKPEGVLKCNILFKVQRTHFERRSLLLLFLCSSWR